MDIPEKVRRFLDTAPYAHVVTLGRDGAAQASLAWVGVEGDEVVMATLSDQRKLWNLRGDPRIVLTFESQGMNPIGLREYLVIYGRARVTEGGAPDLLQRLAHRYLGPDVVFPPMPNPPPGYVTRVTVERIGGIGPWVGPPVPEGEQSVPR